jgi:hypothetical protein
VIFIFCSVLQAGYQHDLKQEKTEVKELHVLAERKSVFQ